MKKKLSVFLILCAVTISWSQGEFTLNNMDHIFQSTYVNSNALPDHKVSIGLPGMSSLALGFANSGFALKDIISTDTLKWNLNNIKSQISAKSNFMYVGANVDLFHVRFRVRRCYVSFNVSNKNNFYFAYPESIGRAALLETKDPVTGDGKPIDLSGLGLDQTSYTEYAVGLSTMQKNFVFGGHLKLLQGLNNFSLSSDNLSLDVDKNLYDLSFKGNSTFHSSSQFDVNNTGNVSSSLFTNFKNVGFGGDLAFTYLFRKNISFNVAVNNIGFITWKTNAIEYKLNSVDASFSGLDVLPSVFAGKNTTGISFTDSTAKNLEPKKDTIKSYTTWLVPNTYLTARYYVTPRLMFSFALMFEYYKQVRVGASIGGQYKLGRLFSLTGTVSYQYSAFNIGSGIVFKPGPFQIYIVADNLLAIEGAIRTAASFGANENNVYAPTSSRTFNIRAGINFVFGREHLNEQQALNKKY